MAVLATFDAAGQWGDTHVCDHLIARHLADQPDDAADRQHKANLDLGPFLRRQIDRDEWAKTGLDVGEKEDEPVKAALALRRAVRLG